MRTFGYGGFKENESTFARELINTNK